MLELRRMKQQDKAKEFDRFQDTYGGAVLVVSGISACETDLTA